MPKLQDGLDQHNLPTGSYGYSAVGIDNLGATEYTLVAIAQDISGSVGPYKKQMEKCLKEIITACKHSPRADNLMIRLIEFGNDLNEIHGFKLLEQCNPNDYNNVLTIKGMTALYDATQNSIASCADYGKQLMENDFSVNAIVFIITDGCENASTATVKSVKSSLGKALKQENLESVITILIGVGIGDYTNIQISLDEFKNDAGLTEFIPVKFANTKTLAKLAEFVSKSISSQSKSLGSGASSPIPIINLNI